MNYKGDLIKYRKERAKEVIEDAKILFNAKRLCSAVNRIYYNEHFVKSGKVSIELGRFFSNMFDFRQKSDYGDFVNFEEQKVQQWLETANQFIEEIDKIIEKEIQANQL